MGSCIKAAQSQCAARQQLSADSIARALDRILRFWLSGWRGGMLRWCLSPKILRIATRISWKTQVAPYGSMRPIWRRTKAMSPMSRINR
jgi:hypothetical protein